MNVTNVAPTASLTVVGQATEGSPVDFLAQVSDPGADTFNYSFDFDDDGDWEIIGQSFATANHTWQDNGLYPVRIRIQDDDGGLGENLTYVQVTNLPPSIIATNNGPRDEGESVTITATPNDPGPLDTLVYSFDFD